MGRHHLCSCWPGAILAPSSALAARTCIASAVLLLWPLGKVNDTECANVLAEIGEGPSDHLFLKETLGSQGRRCVLLVEGTNRPPEQLALGVVCHGQAEPSQHAGHQEIFLGPHPSVRPVVSAVPA